MSFIGKNVEVIRTDWRGWISEAIQALLDGDDILIVEHRTERRCFVPASALPDAYTPAWTVIWGALRDAGIAAPRRPGFGS
jgi:hypothetical protein